MLTVLRLVILALPIRALARYLIARTGSFLSSAPATAQELPVTSPFSSGSVTWYPSLAGTSYVKPFCDNSSITTSCSSVFVSSPSSSSSTTTTTKIGGGGGCRQIGHTCTVISPCCAGFQCIGDICQVQLTITATTTPIGTSTTTNIFKQDCPFDCCQGEDSFNDKSCDSGFQCVANTCQSVSQNPQSGGGSLFSWSIIVPLILIVIFLPLFLFFFILKRKQNEWKKLYEKWRRPRRY